MERDVFKECWPVICALDQHTTDMYTADAVVSLAPSSNHEIVAQSKIYLCQYATWG